jgi:isoleucyl-tRNA synthetase
MKEFQKLIQALDADQIATLQESGSVTLNGESFDLSEIEVLQQPREGTGTLSNRYISVDLDCDLDEELIRGGYAREIVNRLQQYRKEQNLHVADRIDVRYFAADQELLRAAEENREHIMSQTLCVKFDTAAEGALGPAAKKTEIDGRQFAFVLNKAES